MKRVGEKSQVELTLIFFSNSRVWVKFESWLDLKKKRVELAKFELKTVGIRSNPSRIQVSSQLDLNSTQIWAKNWSNLSFYSTRLKPRLELEFDSNSIRDSGSKKIRVESVTRIRLGTRESKLKFVSPLNYSTLVYNAPC